MAISIDSKIKDILANPKAADVCDKYMPGFKTDKQMKMVYGLSLRALAKFPQAKVTAETLDQINKELAEIK